MLLDECLDRLGEEVLGKHDGFAAFERAVKDVTRTIFFAVFLVLVVIFVFLRSLRATIIPAVAIPISTMISEATLFNSAIDRLMAAISHYIKNELSAGRDALREVSLTTIARATQVQRLRLLGLAVGCRMTNALAALPIALFANNRIGGWHAAIRVVAAGAVIGGALFLLPAVTYGFGFFSYEPAFRRDFITGGYKVYRELVGFPLVLGSVVTVAAVLASKPRRQRIRDLFGEPLVVLGGTAVVVLTTPFVLLPTDPQYLLPWVPFGVIFLAGLVRQRVLRMPWAAVLLVAAVVPSAIGFGQLDIDCWRNRRELRPVWIGPGQVTEHYVERIAQLDHASAAARFSYPIGTAVIVGRPFMATQLALGVPERELEDYLHQIPEREVLLFRLIPPWLRDQVDDRPVFYANGEHLIYLTHRIFGYELVDLGAQPLQLWPSDDGDRQQVETR